MPGEKMSTIERLRAHVEDETRRFEMVYLKPDVTRALVAVADAAQTVLAGLNARIDTAPKNAVPVFDGIADLHGALARLTTLEKTP